MSWWQATTSFKTVNLLGLRALADSFTGHDTTRSVDQARGLHDGGAHALSMHRLENLKLGAVALAIGTSLAVGVLDREGILIHPSSGENWDSVFEGLSFTSWGGSAPGRVPTSRIRTRCRRLIASSEQLDSWHSSQSIINTPRAVHDSTQHRMAEALSVTVEN